jgi:uncharacterized protein YqgV (UPF0045/DUF77 family)
LGSINHKIKYNIKLKYDICGTIIQGKKKKLVMEKLREIKRVIFQRLQSMDFVRFLFNMNFRLYSG